VYQIGHGDRYVAERCSGRVRRRVRLKETYDERAVEEEELEPFALSPHPAVHSLLAGPLPEHRPLGLSQNTIMPGSLCSTRTPRLTLYGHAALRSGRVQWMLEELGLPAVSFDHLVAWSHPLLHGAYACGRRHGRSA
jgi:hypothetical protein